MAESPQVWTCSWDHGRLPGRPPGPGLVLQSAPLVQQWRWWWQVHSIGDVNIQKLLTHPCLPLIYTTKTSNGASNVWAKIKCLGISSLKSIFLARLRNHFRKRTLFVTHHMVGINFGNHGLVLSDSCQVNRDVLCCLSAITCSNPNSKLAFYWSYTSLKQKWMTHLCVLCWRTLFNSIVINYI